MPEPASIDSTLRALARTRSAPASTCAAATRRPSSCAAWTPSAEHAAELLAKRLAPTAPHKDGKQTPYRGHPVFVAQHATATCCRSCLQRWHGIPKGRELTADEQAYAVNVICRWIEQDLVAAGRRAPR